MARPKRLEFPGALWHITNRGVEQRNIFLDDDDRHVYLDLFDRTARKFRWRLHQYALMTNHFHLLNQTLEPTLSRGMQFLTGKYAQHFNAKHRRSGHLFKGRFDAQLVEEDSYLLTVARYIVLNPVRARIVATPGDWKWSSYNATACLEKPPDWLHISSVLDRFDEWDRPTAAALYRSFVADAIGREDSPWESLRAGLYLGTDAFIEDIKEMTRQAEWRSEHLKLQQNFRAVDLDDLAHTVTRTFGVKLSPKRWSNEAARSAFAILAREEAIATLSAIGHHLQLTASGACRLIDRARELRDRSKAFKATLLDVKVKIYRAKIKV